jgi:hypothetical protein
VSETQEGARAARSLQIGTLDSSQSHSSLLVGCLKIHPGQNAFGLCRLVRSYKQPQQPPQGLDPQAAPLPWGVDAAARPHAPERSDGGHSSAVWPRWRLGGGVCNLLDYASFHPKRVGFEAVEGLSPEIGGVGR